MFKVQIQDEVYIYIICVYKIKYRYVMHMLHPIKVFSYLCNVLCLCFKYYCIMPRVH